MKKAFPEYAVTAIISEAIRRSVESFSTSLSQEIDDDQPRVSSFVFESKSIANAAIESFRELWELGAGESLDKGEQ